jgi:tRNA G10  N-methylase Trm11
MPTILVPGINKYRSLISPSRDKNAPIYNWHAFKHSYSKDLVGKLIKEFALKESSWVLDPFCGGGTTLLACKEFGINSQGYDILPFSVFLTNVKTRTYNPGELKGELEKIIKSKKTNRNIDRLPDIDIIDKAFSKKVKSELLFLKRQVISIQESKVKDFFMLGLLSILESVSNTSKGGGFLRIVKKRVSSENVRKQFLKRMQTMIEDVESFNSAQKYNEVKSSAAILDSRASSSRNKFDAIITSPPYPNRHDYTRIYSLELIFNFVKNNDQLKQIRYATLRSHVEAKRKFESLDYQEPRIIGALIKKIKKSGLNNSKVPEMIQGYFEDMYISLIQMKKSLKKNGKIALVVSNVRFGGISIPVDKILSLIGDQAGLRTKKIIVARYRGNSAQQMKNFNRRPARESIVIWNNP